MRSRSMQALTNDIAAAYPGVTIYGIGDAAHQLRASDHNEDDTSGSRPAQSDADSNPEHRAIDVMLGPAMSRAQMHALIERIVAAEIARERAGGTPRLFYIIFDGWIWSRSNGWVKQPKLDDPHRDHAHFSGLASGDENGARWPAVAANTNGDDMFDEHDEAVAWATTNRAAALMAGEEFAWFNIKGEEQKYTHPVSGLKYSRREPNEMKRQLDRIEAKVTTPVIDYDKLAAAMIKAGAATDADVRDAVADGFEGGAAAVRADN